AKELVPHPLHQLMEVFNHLNAWHRHIHLEVAALDMPIVVAYTAAIARNSGSWVSKASSQPTSGRPIQEQP
ncbi:hypothetical protein, partial [Propioniciclava flava]